MTQGMGIQHLYVHVPFCARRCSYCDFSIAVRTMTPVEEYVRGVQIELSRYAGTRWSLDTVYFGGGTPSRLGGDGVARLLASVRDVTRIADSAEITLEANPDDVTAESAERWREAGVNRVSLGVQSFDDTVLAWMHRAHRSEQSVRAVELLRQAGIRNVSADLIFALPESLGRDWRADVRRVLDLGVEHVSLYGLTVEPHTPLGRWRERGEVAEAPEETYEVDFLYAHDALTSAGFEHYEVSNYAKGGKRSRHNSSYWSGASYIGVGPSAHSFDGERRTWNVAPYAEWVRRLISAESVVDGGEPLSAENRNVERVYLGLRADKGLDCTDAELQVARSWVKEGWAEIVNGTVVLTPLGWLRLDALAASLTLAGSD